MILGRELRVNALAAKAFRFILREDLYCGNIALGVNGHGSLYIALEALLRALHAVAAIVELVHCADAVGGCIRLRHRQQGTGNCGACALQGGQTDRQGDGRNAHGCIARQPLAPQRYGRKRVGCLLHVITCLFFILPGNPGQQLRPLWLLQQRSGLFDNILTCVRGVCQQKQTGFSVL